MDAAAKMELFQNLFYVSAALAIFFFQIQFRRNFLKLLFFRCFLIGILCVFEI